MPKYSSHMIFNLFALCIIFLIYLQHPFMTTAQAGSFLFAYFLGTVILSPDLDVRSEASRRCGAVCVPYRALSKHRGLSHHPIMGVLARILYFSTIGIVILLILGVTFQQIGMAIPIITAYPYEILAGVFGLFVANGLHILLDKAA